MVIKEKKTASTIIKQNTNEAVERRLDEVITILSETNIHPSAAMHMQEKLNKASELLTGTPSTGLLQNMKLKSPAVKKYILAQKISRVFRLIVALLLILLGFGMVIMPAPKYFEMFTLFYLNPNDGVTIMDVISLIVAFTGISLLISGLIKFNQGNGK